MILIYHQALPRPISLSYPVEEGALSFLFISFSLYFLLPLLSSITVKSVLYAVGTISYLCLRLGRADGWTGSNMIGVFPHFLVDE